MVEHSVNTPLAHRRRPGSGDESRAFLKVVILLLGLAVGSMIPIGIWLAVSASDARHDASSARKAVAASTADASATSMPGMPGMTGTATANGALTSYAGAAPANAAELAAAHTPYPATLPALRPGGVVPVHITLRDVTVQIAPGVKYTSWAFDGGAPGPVVHVRQGQTVKMTLTNGGAIPHSIDFHAARVAPNKAFVDVMPGKSFTFTFRAGDPGVFMYHCGTKPVLMHIANGMYGAIVVEPARPLPHADRQYVLVASEWYLDSPGLKKPAQFSMDKAHARMPDWMTFNGYAGQYVQHPLTADPGDTVRLWVVDAGPSLDTDFHVVGTLLDRAWVAGGLDSKPLENVQTVNVPAGGGGVFDLKIDKAGLYPFVSHAFSSVDLGQVGLLKVGQVEGTMSH